MRRVRQFTRQILARKMQLFVKISSPFGAIGHVINDAVIGDEFPCAAFARVTLQFHFCDDDVWDAHKANYTGLDHAIKKISCVRAGDFLICTFRLFF